jgi:hypothetical protein
LYFAPKLERCRSVAVALFDWICVSRFSSDIYALAPSLGAFISVLFKLRLRLLLERNPHEPHVCLARRTSRLQRPLLNVLENAAGCGLHEK